MSKDPAACHPEGWLTAKLALCVRRCSSGAGFGGADRDRTDDLKLAKLPLSQLSYGPMSQGQWWARVDSNYRPYAYQAYALTT